MKETDLAQVMVQAYYALLGSKMDLSSVVVALTDVGTTHYFQMKLREAPPPPPPPPPGRWSLYFMKNHAEKLST